MVDISSNNIFLEKENHIYKLNDDPDFGFTSVTTFVGDFFEKFDSQGIATKLTMSHPKYKHLTVKELLGQWKKKADYGTLVHEEIELYIKNKFQPQDDRSIRAVKWIDMVQQFKEFIQDIHKDRHFIRAILQCINHPKYEHKRMLRKMKLRGSLMTQSNNRLDYIRQIEAMYNWHAPEDSKVRFF